MRPAIIAVLPVLGLLVRIPDVCAEDDWIGADKALHFSASAAITGAGYAGAACVVEPPWQRAAAGAALGLGAGIAKEVWDATGRGDPSFKDFTWDLAGVAVGVAVSLLIDRLR